MSFSLYSVDMGLYKHIRPQRNAPDLDRCDEGGGILCPPSGDSTPALACSFEARGRAQGMMAGKGRCFGGQGDDSFILGWPSRSR